MASIIKHGKKWRALIDRKGVRKSRVFASKQEARDWANSEEAAILGGAGASSKAVLRDVLDRYAREVSPAKKGYRWEAIRLEKIGKGDLGDKRMCDIKPEDIAKWREDRLKEVAPGSVIREMTLLSSVFSVARREWGMLDKSPMKGVRRPAQPPRRDRLVTADELDRLRLVAGDDLTHARARAFHAFLFAIETGMRAGEIVGLTVGNVDYSARVAHLPRTKNGDPRDVPLSSEAVRLLRALPPADPLFAITSRDLDASWRAVRDRAGIEGLTFHDSRACAATQLSKKLNPLELARMLGHRDLNMLIKHYYRETAESIARRLD
ncbi:tyrosine-type recombinase/integrase [Pseudooceanicola sp. C21-150M6]|uniref:tyrosine-type recombinase/integrase n=1 Tax=Pseudooceanicola sp. C21-150M6 TaxID=3434355 RepID=UPI003D7F613B